MRMSRKAVLYGAGGKLTVASVSTAAHTAANLSSIDWETLKSYGDAIAKDTANTYTNDTKSVTFSDGQTLGIGDVKAVVLNGTVGALTFSNLTNYCFILGFRHNFAVEGTGIHFQFGKTGLGGTDVAFVDSAYNSHGSTAAFRANTSDTSSGGWDSSYMFGTIISAFYNAVPSSLQSVVATMTKWTDNTGGGSDTAAYVTAKSEQFSLAAEFEVFGARTYANSAEQNKQQQYAYYKAGNSAKKYKHSATGTDCAYWPRSPSVSNSSAWIKVSSDGATGSSTYCNISFGFAPIFSIGTAA